MRTYIIFLRLSLTLSLSKRKRVKRLMAQFYFPHLAVFITKGDHESHNLHSQLGVVSGIALKLVFSGNVSKCLGLK